MDALDAVLARHSKVALQLSGGRDSLACLYLLRPYLDRITVYWVNSGAPFPETEATMRSVRALCPSFVEIAGDQPGHVARHGLPSNLVPSTSTPLGRIAAGTGVALQDRYNCCLNVIMVPLHQRMIDDGITLIIRGQKDADRIKGPLRSGARENGIEFLYPIENWSAGEVMAYLKAEGAPLPRFYQMLDSAPDCMTCSAYWEEGVAPYLKQYHPHAYKEVQRRLDTIKEAIAPHIAAFNCEVNL